LNAGAAGRRPALAIAACAAYPDLFDDWPFLRAALDERGVDARPAVWDDPGVDWNAFDLVVANSAWDNMHRPDEFVGWAERLAGELAVPVVNSPATLRWNIDKRYLRDLEAAGVPTVPTTFVEPRDGAAVSAGGLALPEGEVVVKPAVSGGGHRTARYEPAGHDAARAHVASLVADGRVALVQEYQPAVDEEGETGLVFVGGEFSHAFHKEPIIRRGVGPQDSLVANQVVTAGEANEAQLAVAREALVAAERLLGPTTYARADLVTRTDGEPAVLELELLDPVLFFDTCPEGALRFADVLVRALHGDGAG
jgi:hypothetical protein